MMPQPPAVPERDLHAGLLGDLGYAKQLLTDLHAACWEGHHGVPAEHRYAHARVSIVLSWMHDRLRHATGAQCLFAAGSGHCIVEAEGAAS